MVVSLTELFENLQSQMVNMMEQKCIPHAPTKGDLTEEAWRGFFKTYLPKRYSCDKAFIIDHLGVLSDQIDVVIYDEHFSPFIFNRGGVKYIPAESVYAVFEVKPYLSKEYFEYAQQKACSVRCLKRTTAPVYCNGKLKQGRQPPHIIAGILTTHKAWENTLVEQKLDPTSEGFLDIGCCVNGKSWIWNDGQYLLSQHDKNSLLTFFMALLEQLQQLGTVPAMEIRQYFDGFKEDTAELGRSIIAQTDFDVFDSN